MNPSIRLHLSIGDNEVLKCKNRIRSFPIEDSIVHTLFKLQI